MQVQFAADPGIGGGIDDLRAAQIRLRPIRALFLFGNAEAQQQTGERAKAGLFEIERLGQMTDFNKIARGEFPAIVQLFDVVGQCHAGFDDGGILQDLTQRAQTAERLKLEHEHFRAGGELEQGGRITNASLERRPGFRIKTKNGFASEDLHAMIHLVAVVDQPYRSVVRPYRQFV